MNRRHRYSDLTVHSTLSENTPKKIENDQLQEISLKLKHLLTVKIVFSNTWIQTNQKNKSKF